jgi:hypothetical protein
MRLGRRRTFAAPVDVLKPGDVVGGVPDATPVNHGFCPHLDVTLTQIDGPGPGNTFITGITPQSEGRERADPPQAAFPKESGKFLVRSRPQQITLDLYGHAESE